MPSGPPQRVTNTSFLRAMASMTTMPKVSLRDGTQMTSALSKKASRSSLPTQPCMVTLSPKLALAIMPWIFLNQRPLPAMVVLKSTPLLCRLVRASSNRSWPLVRRITPMWAMCKGDCLGLVVGSCASNSTRLGMTSTGPW